MPFQALPIALRANTGTPLSKLLWVYIVSECSIDDAPNGRGFLMLENASAERFCQAAWPDVLEALGHLQRLGLVENFWPGKQDPEGETMIDVGLPMSQLRHDERKRLKPSPDQIDALATKCNYRCAACDATSYDSSTWHVDHIIPRSIGGADTEDNLQLLCPSCNTRKGAKVHWVDFLGGRR